MNKRELADAVAQDAGTSRSQAMSMVTAVFDTISDALREGADVQVHGFGKFEVRTRAARTGRNPQTGAKLQIPATQVAAFKPAKALKDRINS